MAAIDLNRQASENISLAQKSGAEQNFLFITTFKRYQVQLKILGDLEKKLSNSGILVTKEYVKGRQNIYFPLRHHSIQQNRRQRQPHRCYSHEGHNLP